MLDNVAAMQRGSEQKPELVFVEYEMPAIEEKGRGCDM